MNKCLRKLLSWKQNIISIFRYHKAYGYQVSQNLSYILALASLISVTGFGEKKLYFLLVTLTSQSFQNENPFDPSCSTANGHDAFCISFYRNQKCKPGQHFRIQKEKHNSLQ